MHDRDVHVNYTLTLYKQQFIVASHIITFGSYRVLTNVECSTDWCDVSSTVAGYHIHGVLIIVEHRELDGGIVGHEIGWP